MQPSLELIGALARLARVQPCICLPGPLLVLQLFSTEVPVVDLFREPILHRGFGLVEKSELAIADLCQVLRDDIRDRIALALCSRDRGRSSRIPAVPRSRQAGLAFLEGAIVEIGCIVEMARSTGAVDLDEQQALRDDAAFARFW